MTAEKIGSDLEGPEPFRASEGAAQSHPEVGRTSLHAADAVACDEVAFLRETARGILEEIGTCLHLRVPDEDEAWARMSVFDERLLCQWDYLASMASIVGVSEGTCREACLPLRSDILRWAADTPVADPVRAAASTFVFGSDGTEAGARRAVLFSSTSPPEVLEAQRCALSLCASPALAAPLREAVRSGAARTAELAVRVMVARSVVDLETLVPLFEHPDEELRAAAALAACHAEETSRAAELLATCTRTEAAPHVLAAIATALLMLGRRQGLRIVRDELRVQLASDDEDRRVAKRTLVALVRLLGVAGTRDDREILRSLLRAPWTDRRVRAEVWAALGWLGDVATVPDLAAGVRDGEAGAMAALEQMLGIDLGQDTTAADVEKLLAEVCAPLDPSLRYRRGLPYVVRSSVDELAHDEARQGDRRLAALEVAMQLGRPLPGFHVEGWVASQRTAIRRALDLIPRKAAVKAGSWVGASLKD